MKKKRGIRGKRFIVRRRYVVFRVRQVGSSILRGVRYLFGAAAVALVLYGGQQFWKEAPVFKVKSVQISSQFPRDARLLLPKKGDHLFQFSPSALEIVLLNQFPELTGVQIRRHWDGRVTAEADRRLPIARTLQGDLWYGIDQEGVAFSLDSSGGDHLPVLRSDLSVQARAGLMEVLSRIKNTSWGKQLRQLSTESSGDIILGMDKGIVVHWGKEHEGDFNKKSNRLERVLSEMAEREVIGELYFVREDRILLKKTEKP